MIESLLVLNPFSRDVARLVNDSGELHRFVMRGFPVAETPSARATLGVLHRLETDRRTGALGLVVRSQDQPNWSHVDPSMLCELDNVPNPNVVSISPLVQQVRAGAVFRFRLRANPVRKVDTKSGPNGERRNGKRVPVRGHDGRVAWLRRQAEGCGFELVHDSDVIVVDALEEGVVRGARGAAYVVHHSVRYEGLLCVVEPERFRSALKLGVGRGRAYGFGLLSVSSVS